MKPKILEQEAKMNRFKKEVALKLYFKNQKTRENQRIASGYTKVIMLLQKENYGALLSYQEDIKQALPRLTIKDILRQRILNTQLLKRIYRERIELRKWAEFRPLKILIEKEAKNAKSL
jgi:hypothetical protein